MKTDGYVDLDEFKLTYTWKVSTLELDEYTGGPSKQSNFTFGVFDMEWKITSNSKGVGYSEFSDLLLYTRLMKSNDYPVSASISYFILNSAGEKLKMFSNVKNFERAGAATCTDTMISKPKLINKNGVVDYHITITCQIDLNLSKKSDLHAKTLYFAQTSTDDLINDFNKFMNVQESGDVSLNVSGKVFRAHKCILSLHSPFFAALFKYDMKESKEIDIDETGLDVFQEMLFFMYTGKVKNLDKLAFELLSLSDRYGLEDLKKLCELYLKANIDVDNCIDIYLLSDKHSVEKLKAESFNFIVNNRESVINTSKYEEFVSIDPSFASKILFTLRDRNILSKLNQ